jgi:hypothetical protein
MGVSAVNPKPQGLRIEDISDGLPLPDNIRGPAINTTPNGIIASVQLSTPPEVVNNTDNSDPQKKL